MKIVQNARFRSCAAGFTQIVFVRVKLLKIGRLVSTCLQNGKTVRFSWKLYKTLVSGHAQDVLAKSHFKASKCSKSSHWPQILSKTGKQCAFHENCTKRSFQVIRSTFWPNRIFKSQSCQNRHTGLKRSSKREKGALFMKIVQNACFRSCAAGFDQIVFVRVKLLKIGRLVSNSLQNGKTVRFSWKLYKTLFSGHAQHVLAESHFWASKLSKSSHWPEVLFKTRKQCAFHENCTKRAFQVMRSTFWPNCIFERQSCQNRHTALKFSPKRGKGARFMKIVQNARFRSCAARFGQITFLRVKVVKIVTLAWNSRQNGKTVRFSWKFYKKGFSGHAQHVLAKSHFWAWCAFHESCQNRHTGLEFSSKRGKSALLMKIVQHALFRWCAARFGQNAFLSVKVAKIVTLAWISLQNGKTVRFPWKLYKTGFSGLFRSCAAWLNCICERKLSKSSHWPEKLGHAQHVLAKSHFWASKFSKSSHWPPILFRTCKQFPFHENCTKRAFQVMRSTFWPNRIFERQSCQNRHTALKFSPKRGKGALFMKVVQNALFRSCAARFGLIAFVSVKVVKIVTLAWKARQNAKRVRFLWILYKTLVSTHAQEVLPKSCFSGSNFLKSLDLSQILLKTGKQCAFHENCTKRSFQVIRSTFWPNCICERQSCQNRHTGLKSSSKREKNALFMKIVQNARFRSCAGHSLQNGERVGFLWKLYKTLVSGDTQHVLAQSHFWASKLSKSSHWPGIVFKTGKQCAFHKNCTKRAFQVMRSTFWPNRIFKRQSCQNRHTGLKFSPKRGKGALFMKIVQNARFRSYAARFGQIAFVSVKVVKIVTLPSNSLQNGERGRFSWKLYKTLFSGHAQHVLA